jgi:hypothetical protein
MAAAAPAGADGGGGGGGGSGPNAGGDLFNRDSKGYSKMQFTHPPSGDKGRTQSGLKHYAIRERPKDYRTLCLSIPLSMMGGGAFSFDMITDENLVQQFKFLEWLRKRCMSFHLRKSKDDIKEVEDALKALNVKEYGRNNKRVVPIGRPGEGIGDQSNMVVVRGPAAAAAVDGDGDVDMDAAERKFDVEHKGDNADSKNRVDADIRERKQKEDLLRRHAILTKNKQMPACVVAIEGCMGMDSEPKASHAYADADDVIRPFRADDMAPEDDEKDIVEEAKAREPEVKILDESKVKYVRLWMYVFDPEGEQVEQQYRDAEGRQQTKFVTVGYRISKILSDYFEECAEQGSKRNPGDQPRLRKGRTEPIMPDHPFLKTIRTPSRFDEWCRGILGLRPLHENDQNMAYDDARNPIAVSNVFSVERALKASARIVLKKQCQIENYSDLLACPYRYLFYYPTKVENMWIEILPWKHSVTILKDAILRVNAEGYLSGQSEDDIYKLVDNSRLRQGQQVADGKMREMEHGSLIVYLTSKGDIDGKFEKESREKNLQIARDKAAEQGSIINEEEVRANIDGQYAKMCKRGEVLFEMAVDEWVETHQVEKIAYIDKRVIRSWNDLRDSLGQALIELDAKLSERFSKEGTSVAEQRRERADARRRLRESRLTDFMRIMNPQSTDTDVSPFQRSLHMAIASYLNKNGNFVRPCNPHNADGTAAIDAFDSLRTNLEKGFKFVHTHETWIAAALAAMYVYSGDPFPIHIFLYGPEGCGKSYVVEELRNMLIKNTCLTIQKETEMSMSSGANMDDNIFAQDEIRPDDWRGKDGKSGNMQATIKSRMSRGEMENFFLYLPPDGPRQLRHTRTQCKTCMIIAMNIDPLRELERPIQARAACKKMGLGRGDDAKIVSQNSSTHVGPEHAGYRDDIKINVHHWQMLAYIIFKQIYCGFLDDINVDVASDMMLKILDEANRNGISKARNVRNAHRMVCMMKSIVVYRVIQERFKYYPLFDKTASFSYKDIMQLQPFLVATEADMHLAMELLKFQFSDADADDIRTALVNKFFSTNPKDKVCPYCGRKGSEPLDRHCPKHDPTSPYVLETGKNLYNHDTFFVPWAKANQPVKVRNKDCDYPWTMAHVLKPLLPDMEMKGLEAAVGRLLTATAKDMMIDGKEFKGEAELARMKVYKCMELSDDGFSVSKAWIWGSGLNDSYEDAFSKVMTYEGQDPKAIFLASGLRPCDDYTKSSPSVWNYRRYKPCTDFVINIPNTFQLTEEEKFKIESSSGEKAKFNVENVAQNVTGWKIEGNATVHAISEHIKQLGVSSADLQMYKERSPLFPADETSFRERFFSTRERKMFFIYQKLEKNITDADRRRVIKELAACTKQKPADDSDKKMEVVDMGVRGKGGDGDKENKSPNSSDGRQDSMSSFDSNWTGPLAEVMNPAPSDPDSKDGWTSFGHMANIASASASASASSSQKIVDYAPQPKSTEQFEVSEARRRAQEARIAREAKSRKRKLDEASSLVVSASKRASPTSSNGGGGGGGGGGTNENGSMDNKHNTNPGNSREVSVQGPSTPSPPHLVRQDSNSLPVPSAPLPPPPSQRFPLTDKASSINSQLASLINLPGLNVGTHHDVMAQRRDMEHRAELDALQRKHQKEARLADADLDGDLDMDEARRQEAENDREIAKMDL